MHKVSEEPDSAPKLVRHKDVSRLVGFGWYFASSLGVGLGGGIALDSGLDTEPIFLLVGLLIGTAAGFYGMFKMLMPLYKRDARDRDVLSGSNE